MRINEVFEKVGFFWLPNDEANKKHGTLRILNGGKIELEIVGNFDEDITSFNKDWEMVRILGFIENEGYVTLEKCFYTKKNLSFGNISKSKIHVSLALCGAIWDKDEEVTFSTLEFSLDCLDEWVGITGIQVSHDWESKTASINYLPQQNIFIGIEGKFKLEICFKWTLPGSPKLTEAKITQRAFLKLISETLLPLEDFIDMVFKITNLLCFAIDDTVSIKDLIATSPDITFQISEGKTKLAPVKLYYESQPYSEKEPKKDWHQMLFNYNSISTNAAIIFNGWLSAYETLSPAMGLYFSTKTDAYKYIDAKFLALAQGLETYHRRTSDEKLMEESEYEILTKKITQNCPDEHLEWLNGRIKHGNEINLNKRLKAIIEPFKNYLGDSAQQKKLLRQIVVTRNYLTHYSPELEREAMKGADFIYICQKMEAIFGLHFLKVIGFTKDEIERIVTDSQVLKSKLQVN